MPLAAAINEDNEDCAVHELDEETKKYWNQLKNYWQDQLPKFYLKMLFLFPYVIMKKKKNI